MVALTLKICAGTERFEGSPKALKNTLKNFRRPSRGRSLSIQYYYFCQHTYCDRSFCHDTGNTKMASSKHICKCIRSIQNPHFETLLIMGFVYPINTLFFKSNATFLYSGFLTLTRDHVHFVKWF